MDTRVEKKEALVSLQKGEIALSGQFVVGSNYTFLVRVSHEGSEFTAVYKPSRGERPLWDFPEGTLAQREVAAFLVSEALGWDLVPPTVYRRNAPHGHGSLQLFVEHDQNYHYFNFRPEDRGRLQPAALFDVLINNADRKGGHILFDAHDHLWLIDHGLCFHIEDKLRTVIWDFAGQPIPGNLLMTLSSFLSDLESPKSSLSRLLGKLLNGAEIQALETRSRQLISSCQFPMPIGDRRPYPWPPV